jgi:hypothetical protein
LKQQGVHRQRSKKPFVVKRCTAKVVGQQAVKMTQSIKALIFPHPILMPIIGEPTIVSIKKLKKQIFTNARAIHSTRGGGANGHLACVIITETNRQFAHDLAEFSNHNATIEGLKQQILQAIAERYLNILEDDEFGYADVTPIQMLTHIQDTYGQVTNEARETNRNMLSAIWNVDGPIKDVWICIQEAQRFATSIGPDEVISDNAAIGLTLAMFEQTGVFGSVTKKWRDKAEEEWTMEVFQAHFNKGNKERICKLTAKAAGYHGANAAINNSSDTVTTLTASTNLSTGTPDETAYAATNNIQTNSQGANELPGNIQVNDSPTMMYYCWSHGLGTNQTHTSFKCTRKTQGHQDNATADNMMGGNNRIMGPPCHPGNNRNQE